MLCPIAACKTLMHRLLEETPLEQQPDKASWIEHTAWQHNDSKNSGLGCSWCTSWALDIANVPVDQCHSCMAPHENLSNTAEAPMCCAGTTSALAVVSFRPINTLGDVCMQLPVSACPDKPSSWFQDAAALVTTQVYKLCRAQHVQLQLPTCQLGR